MYRTTFALARDMEKPPIELVVQALETFSRHHDPAEQQKASKWLEQLQRSVRETARRATTVLRSCGSNKRAPSLHRFSGARVGGGRSVAGSEGKPGGKLLCSPDDAVENPAQF